MPEEANAILVAGLPEEAARIAAALRAAGPYPVWLAEEDFPPEAIGCLVAYRPPPGLLARLPRLRLVHGTGAGVDALLADPDLPPVPLGRVVGPELSRMMVHHVLAALLRHLRRGETYAAQQRERLWLRHPPRDVEAFRVVVLGTGALGGAVLQALSALGIPAAGWNRRSGPLAEALAGAMAAVVLLPATPATRGILGRRELAALADDALVIAAGRGGQVDEEALLAELDAGRLSAALDVFNEEPLPPASPFWTHPRCVVTPHIAAAPDPAAVARCVLESMARIARGEPPLFPVDRARGY
ncbi:MAG: glyoxylate/hydroxypyruvate reductase A [Roseococcus sp.]|nr:glyoxylate/hydroxypyruvate reductase A [Roseococcus sp.]